MVWCRGSFACCVLKVANTQQCPTTFADSSCVFRPPTGDTHLPTVGGAPWLPRLANSTPMTHYPLCLSGAPLCPYNNHSRVTLHHGHKHREACPLEQPLAAPFDSLRPAHGHNSGKLSPGSECGCIWSVLTTLALRASTLQCHCGKPYV